MTGADQRAIGGQIMESLTCAGTWWLPDHPEDRVGATLSFERETGLSLRLTSPFRSDHMKLNGIPRVQPIIFGESTEGKLITLRQAYVTTRRQFWMPGRERIEIYDIRAEEAFLGAHLQLGAETLVQGVRIELDILDDWAWGNQLLANEVSMDDGHTQRVDYRIPEPINFKGFGGKAQIAAALKRSSESSSDETVRRVSYLEVAFDHPLPYSGIDEVVLRPFQYFLTFACAFPAHIQRVAFWTEGLDQSLADDRYPTFIECLRQQVENKPQKRPTWWELLLPLKTINERLGDVFERWSNLLGHAGIAIDLFSGITLGPQQYLETRFIFAIQALEVYHRRCPWFENKLIPKSEWRARWRTLKRAAMNVSPELENWVNERISDFSNEPRLRDRLTELVAYGGDQSARVLREDFIDLATNTRHGLTHYNPSIKVVEGADLYWLAEEAMALMEACLLRDLGLAPEDVFQATKETQRTRNLLNRRN